MVKYINAVAAAVAAVAIYAVAFNEQIDRVLGTGVILIAAVVIGTAFLSTVSLKKREQVDHPSHYNVGSVEVIDIIWPFGFNQGNAMKYLLRAGHKDDCNQEMGKAKNYLGFAMQHPEQIVSILSPEYMKEWEGLLTTIDEREDISADMVRLLMLVAGGKLQDALELLGIMEDKNVH